jgi:hypothetical protein
LLLRQRLGKKDEDPMKMPLHFKKSYIENWEWAIGKSFSSPSDRELGIGNWELVVIDQL